MLHGRRHSDVEHAHFIDVAFTDNTQKQLKKKQQRHFMEDFCYLIGLWEGDGYRWSGSIGITNRNQEILQKAKEILQKYFSLTIKTTKDKKGIFRVYVNNRFLEKQWNSIIQKTKIHLRHHPNLTANYFAGKYDADGCKWKKRNRFKITYNSKDKETMNFDIELLKHYKILTKPRKYKNRNAFDLEISSTNATNFYNLIKKHSVKLCSIQNGRARAARCPVKSGNEQDLYHYLLTSSFE